MGLVVMGLGVVRLRRSDVGELPDLFSSLVKLLARRGFVTTSPGDVGPLKTSDFTRLIPCGPVPGEAAFFNGASRAVGDCDLLRDFRERAPRPLLSAATLSGRFTSSSKLLLFDICPA